MTTEKRKNNKFGFSRFLLLSILAAAFVSLICSSYLEVSDIKKINKWQDFYFYAYSFFYYVFFCLFILLPAWLISLSPIKKVTKWVAVSTLFIFSVLFVADTFIYQQFRLHLNLAMLQMTLLGGGQVVQFSLEMLAQIVGLIICCLIVVILLWKISGFLSCKSGRIPLILIWVFLVLGFLGVQAVYGYSYATQKTEFTRVNSLLPWNHPIRFNKLLVKTGLVHPDELHTFHVSSAHAKMSYPLKTLDCRGTDHEYNILFIFVDALRYDMLDPQIMPFTWDFASRSTVFKEHFSGGINTRHGIFTLFTGLPGSYWEKSLETKSGSALIKALQQRNYEIGIFAGAPLTMPEFNQTVFATIPNLRVKSPGSSVLERDAAAVNDFKHWLTNLPKNKKYFGFIFLDNVHAQAFPGEPEKAMFQPFWKEVNQLKLSNSFDREPYFNRYKNAVYYADQQIGSILKNLSKRIDFDNTIVIISADHGEEFNDTKLNYWGHNGNFTKYQIQVPFIVKWPGKKIPFVSYRTSMLDVVPTILPEVLGCKNPTEEYSVGENLFAPKKDREWLYGSNYSRSAFIEKDRIVLINEFGILEYLDPDYRPSKNTAVPKYLREVIEETTRFLK